MPAVTCFAPKKNVFVCIGHCVCPHCGFEYFAHLHTHEGKNNEDRTVADVKSSALQGFIHVLADAHRLSIQEDFGERRE